MEALSEMNCRILKKGTPPLDKQDISDYLGRLSSGWEVLAIKRIRKQYPFENFRKCMAFAQEVALLAEGQNHHPDLCIHYTSVEVELSTHDVGGLSQNDFILAAKIDAILLF